MISSKLFSKFSLSFILLLCVFFLIYLLYTNYQNEDEVSKLQIELENELRESINENSKFIKNISKEILETKTALINIDKLIKENSNNESKVDLTSINESIELLNKGSDEEHQRQVKKCIKYIFQGEIFQANLSRLWNYRVDKGIDTLSYNVKYGLNAMPAMGLCADCTDEELRAVVQYMLDSLD